MTNPVLIAAGWLTCAGWQAEITAAAFFTGTLIQGMIVENHSDYGFQRWHGTLLTWAAIVLAVAFNTSLSLALPKVEGMVLVLHVLGFVAILIPLVYLAPHSAPSEVFAVFLNSGGWSSQGLAFFIGLIRNATAFLGKFEVLTSTHTRAKFDEGTDGAIHVCHLNLLISFLVFNHARSDIPTPLSVPFTMPGSQHCHKQFSFSGENSTKQS